MEIESPDHLHSQFDLEVDNPLKQSLGELVDMLDILGVYADFEKSYLASLRTCFICWKGDSFNFVLLVEGFYQTYSYRDLLRSSSLDYLQHISYVLSIVYSFYHYFPLFRLFVGNHDLPNSSSSSQQVGSETGYSEGLYWKLHIGNSSEVFGGID